METIEINGKSVVIKKLALRKYPEILVVVKRILQNNREVLNENIDTDMILEQLPELLKNNFPDVVEAVSIAIDEPANEIAEYGLDDFIVIVKKFAEINKFSFIYDEIKKMKAHPVTKTVLPTQEVNQPAQN